MTDYPVNNNACPALSEASPKDSAVGQFGAEYYRGCLSKQGQLFYDCINTQLQNGNYSGTTVLPVINKRTSAADSFAAYKAVKSDHPEYFFLGDRNETVCNEKTVELKYPVLYSNSRIKSIQSAIEKYVHHIVHDTLALPLTEREITVYERIACKLRYENHNNFEDHCIVGPVLYSSGVCDGFSALLILCFRQIGIPCIKINGTVDSGGRHCWVIAWINGCPVHCDITGDIAEKDIVFFNYFNLSDGQISRDHYSFQNIHLPVCESINLNYYRQNNLCVKSPDELRALVRNIRESSDPLIRIHFDYIPEDEDFLNEIQKAFVAEKIVKQCNVYYNFKMRNYTVRIISKEDDTSF